MRSPATHLRALVALAALLSCRRRPTPPTDAAPTVNLAIAMPDVVAPLDAAAHTDATAERPAPRRAPLAGPWRDLPRVSLTQAVTVSAWTDPPDLDGDGLPDAVSAVESIGLLCAPSSPRHPCPAVDPAAAPEVYTLAFVAVFTSEAPPERTDGDVADQGRLLGVRSVWRSSASPQVSVRGVTFGEFGPGLVARTTLDVASGGAVDVIDVVDLFAGLGAEHAAGALVHHCARGSDGVVRRLGALSVAMPSYAPLVWRAALSHPYSACPVEPDGLDRALGALLQGGVAARVTRTEPVFSRRPVALRLDGDALHLEERTGRPPPPDAGASDPLTLGDVGHVAMSHGCGVDRLRFTRGAEHCAVLVDRDDPALPGCRERPSPLDPAPPRPVMLRAEGAEAALVFARGGALWSLTLPSRCHHGGGHPLDAQPYEGPLRRGLFASPDGAWTVVDQGLDLWATSRGHARPRLLNPPGGALPRGTTRDLLFTGDRAVAAVLSTSLYEFTLDDVDTGSDAPEALTLDAAEVRRGLDVR